MSGLIIPNRWSLGDCIYVPRGHLLFIRTEAVRIQALYPIVLLPPITPFHASVFIALS